VHLGFPYLLLVAVLAVAPTIDLFPSLGWHDQQRVLQIMAFAVAILGLCQQAIRSRKAVLAGGIYLGLWLLWGLGWLCVLASFSLPWALTEFALWHGLWAVMLYMILALQDKPERLQVLFCLVAFVVAFLCIQFLASLLSAFLSGAKLYARALLDGFENLRWLGQFQTLSLPLLAGLVLMQTDPRWKRLSYVLLVIWWITVWLGETRGTWLSITTVLMVSVCLGPLGRRWGLVLGSAGALGFGFFIAIFYFLADWLGVPYEGRGPDALVYGSSGRIGMWLDAMEKAADFPWLGRGPMSYAGDFTFPFSHPHNALVQLVYEWGFPFALVVFVLLLIAAGHCASYLLKTRSSRDVTAYSVLMSLAALLVHSMVSGVVVMPYLQLWLAVLAGAAFSCVKLHDGAGAVGGRRLGAGVMGLMLTASLAVLVAVTVRDLPRLIDFEPRQNYGGDGPRFWSQGGIRLDDKTGLIDRGEYR